MSNIIEAEVTVTKVWEPKGKYFAFNCAELKTDTNKYGRVSAPVALYKKILQNGVYRIAYHETEGGYLNLDTLFSDTPIKEPLPRPPTNPKDSDRMGRMGMVNAILSSCTGMSVSDWLNTDHKYLASLIVKCAMAIDHAEKAIKESKGRNPTNIETGKCKQKDEEMGDEIPGFGEDE